VLEAAIWAENVPFNETRDYVKKVLSNTTNYAAFITGKPQSLKARLGMIGPVTSLSPAKTLLAEELP
jgi:soluble lytic murein transglycosylase